MMSSLPRPPYELGCGCSQPEVSAVSAASAASALGEEPARSLADPYSVLLPHLNDTTFWPVSCYTPLNGSDYLVSKEGVDGLACRTECRLRHEMYNLASGFAERELARSTPPKPPLFGQGGTSLACLAADSGSGLGSGPNSGTSSLPLDLSLLADCSACRESCLWRM